ncbi:MAG: hypothetical protein KA968_09540 [Chitinophagaceae bacterium]|nr:hypothetical protein [Chitinophagaceae bacterium]HQX97193.1 hypothetical protein [Chitinophagaceae bacterium]HQZ51186.1 hypothetical protein [Chitinophagaceae bacterium]HRA11882.1 hypothetical protein [Chitinophagaceae bacterium]
MKILLILTCLPFLCTSSVKAQEAKIKIDSLKSLLQNIEGQNNSWICCQNISNFFNSDTLIIRSTKSTGRLPQFCDSDTISIINFGDGTALISEKSKTEGRINEFFSTVNTYQTVFKKKRKSSIIIFKNYDNTFTYRVSQLKKESMDLNYIVVLVKRKNFR